MIVVCDSMISDRVLSLREEIFDAGFPCTASTVDGIRSIRPIKLIVAFCDMYESVRQTPNDDIPILAVGEGFVNSALNAKKADRAEISREIGEMLYENASGFEKSRTAFGINLGRSLFLSDDFFAINGNIVEPTECEYMIFKYVLHVTHARDYATAENIRRFCFTSGQFEKESSSNSIAVHIANLNKKIECVYKERIIKSCRGRGYFVAEL